MALWTAVAGLFCLAVGAAVSSYEGTYVLGTWFRAGCGACLALALTAMVLALYDNYREIGD